ncbi:MAG: hypothetical protein GY730_05250 [bacterium]|nr:hypothetical protein [bacterium]
MDLYFSFLLALIAINCLFIGTKVLFTKKPIIFHSKYSYSIMLMIFSPTLFDIIKLLPTEASDNFWFIPYLLLTMLIFLFTFLWFQMKGYTIIGIHDESFRNALHFALKKNNLPFEEKLSMINLTSTNTILQVAIQSWTGTGHIKLKESKHSILPQIISDVNKYYKINTVKPNNFTSIFYIIMGLFFVVIAGSIYMMK